MAEDKTNTVDPNTGTKTYVGPSEITKGNHDNMPKRDSSYLPTDERGHIQASSLGGSNKPENIAPQSYDLNHGSWLSMENAEKAAINDEKNPATIQSEKTAFASNQPGGRPDAFTAKDTINFADGNTQTVNLSFANMQNDQQAAINDEVNAQTESLMDEYANPGDTLRDSMTAEEYAELMEETDAALPNIADYYSEWDYQGNPTVSETETSTADWDGVTADGTVAEGGGVSTDSTGATTDSGSTADPGGAEPDGGDSGAGPDGGDDGGASADDD